MKKIIFFILIIFTIVYIIKENIKKNKGVILMYCTQNIINKWAKYSIDINKKYANKNGYDFRLIKNPYDDSVTHAWQKIPAMINLLNEGYDFVFYIDADAIINDPNIKLESFNKYKGDLLVCSDETNSNGLYAVNGGAVIVKNTEKVKKLLKQWWDLRNIYTTFAFEQTALSDIFRNKIDGIDSSIISVCPETEFNSAYFEILNYLKNPKSIPNRFVLHFMSIDDDIRYEILKKIWLENN